MSAEIDIIMINRNSGRLLLNSLRSIEGVDREGFHLSEIVVVDDCSYDDSLDGIDMIGLPIRLIRNDKRLGYGASCNRAAQCCRGDYILFLNTDTLLASDSLAVSLAYIEQPANRQVGIVGIMLLDDLGKVSRSCTRFPTAATYFVLMFGLNKIFPSVFPDHQMKEWDHLSTRQVDHVIGAFMLMRRSLFDELGGYDERFFVYMEDLDISLRASQRGQKSVYLSSAAACHSRGGTSEKAKVESMFFSLRSRIQYAFKHFGTLSALAVAVGTVLIEPFARLLLSVARRSSEEAGNTIKAYLRLWRWVLLGKPRTV
jgi:GT2 family glycosyltransferase